ncbi:MAG: 3-phosphoshikimate 1-carboxyvinyltransferase [Deltaproteobacteria bacterium]|nr:MAG: 3-phosphoshikimate 1-carboxyvinyltransferase [Deltaproteobacteria bacterium]
MSASDGRWIAPAEEGLRGRVQVPGDKSVSHRVLIFAGLAEGRARVRGLLDSADVDSTRRCMEALGVDIVDEGDARLIHGAEGRLTEPDDVLDCGNSGTTMRLLCGLLAGQPFHAVLTGDASLRRRPMRRVTGPLSSLGARLDGRQGASLAPLSVRGTRALTGGEIETGVASAQVKSALLLAGLQGRSPLQIVEPGPSRDHSERMLAALGAQIRRLPQDDGSVRVELVPGRPLKLSDVDVPGDVSSAAFWLVAASIVPGSDLVLPGVGLNPTRTGLVDVLRAMGASIDIVDPGLSCGEPVGAIRVRSAPLRAIDLDGPDVVRLIDEIPVLAVAAAMARGVTTIRGAQELRHKESDRIASTVAMLRQMGATVDELPDGLRVHGRAGEPFPGGRVDSHGDHRIAMAAAVAALASSRGCRLRDPAAVTISYPSFFDTLEELRA